MKYLMTTLLLVLCLGLVALGADVVDGGTVGDQPVWVILLPAIVAIIIAVLERMGKKDALKKLNGAIEVGRTVFAAIEETEAVGAKKLVRRAIDSARSSPEAKEITSLLHNITDPKAARFAVGSNHVPPIKRFWRRMLRGQNLVGVAAKIAVNGAIQGYINGEDD